MTLGHGYLLQLLLSDPMLALSDPEETFSSRHVQAALMAMLHEAQEMVGCLRVTAWLVDGSQVTATR